jgi:hypothetical protein
MSCSHQRNVGKLQSHAGFKLLAGFGFVADNQVFDQGGASISKAVVDAGLA